MVTWSAIANGLTIGRSQWMNRANHARVVGITLSGRVARLTVLSIVITIGAIPPRGARTSAHAVVTLKIGVRIAVRDIVAPSAVRGRR